jgi:hypothetical protein
MILGMKQPQTLEKVSVTGAGKKPTVANLQTGSDGINFVTKNEKIEIKLPEDRPTRLTSIEVPPGKTNVNQVTVTITTPDGKIVFSGTSPKGSTVVLIPGDQEFPAGSTVTITLKTNNNQPAQSVTLNMTGCFESSTTVVSTASTASTPLGTTVITGTEEPTGSTILVVTTTVAGQTTTIGTTRGGEETGPTGPTTTSGTTVPPTTGEPPLFSLSHPHPHFSSCWRNDNWKC